MKPLVVARGRWSHFARASFTTQIILDLEITFGNWCSSSFLLDFARSLARSLAHSLLLSPLFADMDTLMLYIITKYVNYNVHSFCRGPGKIWIIVMSRERIVMASCTSFFRSLSLQCGQQSTRTSPTHIYIGFNSVMAFTTKS